MKQAIILKDVCENCSPCMIEENCEFKAIIRENPTDKPWVDSYRCSGCLKCKVYCTKGAVRDVSVPFGGSL